MENTSAVSLVNITKTFGSVVANNRVNFSVNKGEIHAILGENGSGKSTLMNVLSGIYSPDGGQIFLEGKQVVLHSPKEAIKLGVGMIHQHFKLVEVISAQDNIIGGREGGLLVARKKTASEIDALCRRYSLPLEPAKKVYRMSVGERQTVEIVKALYRGASILILDEPTAVLTPQETERLFDILRSMKAEGCAIIIITHKLNEVMAVSDRVTVLHKGTNVGTLETSATSAQQLAELMVGRVMDMDIKRLEIPAAARKTVLQIEKLSVSDSRRGLRLRDVSLDLHSHEILGVAGVAGSGQKELCEAITGLLRAEGSIRFQGRELLGMNPRSLMKNAVRISFVPEDRLGMGLLGGMSIVENVCLKSYRKTRGICMDRNAARQKAEEIVARYSVSTPSVSQRINRLSGGNIQKILLGREIDLEPDLLIAAYPVRGLDIGASYFIYDKLNEQKQKGVAILLIGEDLDVLLGLCDRIAVLHGGALMGVVEAKETTKEALGLMMMGEGEKHA